MTERFLPLKEVMQITCRKKSTIYHDIKNGNFPIPKKIGKRAIAFRESDINLWMESRVSAVFNVGGSK